MLLPITWDIHIIWSLLKEEQIPTVKGFISNKKNILSKSEKAEKAHLNIIKGQKMFKGSCHLFTHLQRSPRNGQKKGLSHYCHFNLLPWNGVIGHLCNDVQGS